MGRVGSPRKGMQKWRPEDDAELLRCLGKREPLRGKMSETDFWTLVGGDMRPPITFSAARQRWKRMEAAKRRAEESAAVGPSPSSEPAAVPAAPSAPEWVPTFRGEVADLRSEVRELLSLVRCLASEFGVDLGDWTPGKGER